MITKQFFSIVASLILSIVAPTASGGGRGASQADNHGRAQRRHAGKQGPHHANTLLDIQGLHGIPEKLCFRIHCNLYLVYYR